MSSDISMESRTSSDNNTGSSSQSTIHYAKPVHSVKMDNHMKVLLLQQSPKKSSASNSTTTTSTPRSPNIRYPTVVVNNNTPGSPKSSTYAVPIPKTMNNSQYSPIQLQYEHIRHRCKMLDEENQKLMKMQSEVASDANRRVQMHVNEIRMLKEENRKILASQKELRDLCCFLDDDRQKTKKLAREWQKFGRYTSNLMKQEIQTYHQRLSSLEEKLSEKENEVEELRQLCMYLDEQRQCLMTTNTHMNTNNISHRSDDESEDLGCGSSEQSAEGTSLQNDFNIYNKMKESKLRLISEQMTTSQNSEASEKYRKDESRREKTRLLGYIQSLENRIKHLEMSQNHETFWTSNSNFGSECDEKTIIERSWNVDEEISEESQTLLKETQPKMIISMTNSDCTTYASSGTDVDSVYVMGDEIEVCPNLEVRTLSRIDEENEIMRESARMPPKIAPAVCGSILTPFENPLMRSFSESSTPKKPTVISAKGSVRCSSVEIKNNQS